MLRHFKCIKPVLLCASVLLSNLCLAEVELGQVKKAMTEGAIPNWKKAAALAKEIVASHPNKSWRATWQMLDNEATIGSGTKALSRASNPRDTSELLGNAMWLRWKILSENADGRYSYVYAFDLWHMKGADGDYSAEAAVFLYNARLALAIDGARCADRSSMEAVVTGYETQRNFRPLLEMVEKMSPKEKAIAMLEAISIEEMRGERPAMEALCAQGVGTNLEAMNRGRQRQKVPDSALENTSILEKGNTYTIDTSGIKPELIPTGQWKKIRREILDKNTSRAAKSL